MHFRDLNEAQILALAVTAEEEDARIYRDFAESLRTDFPATAELFTRMAGEEDGHRHRLIEGYRQRFGVHIPLIRRQDVKGFVVRRPSWFTRTLRPEHARAEAALMEIESRRFYEAAAQRTSDAGIRQLLDDLAQEEQRHEATAEEITDAQATSGALSHERDAARRLFIALVVVAVELAVIAWIRKRYMDTPLLSAVFQVVVGGVLVFLAGWLIGTG